VFSNTCSIWEIFGSKWKRKECCLRIRHWRHFPNVSHNMCMQLNLKRLHVMEIFCE